MHQGLIAYMLVLESEEDEHEVFPVSETQLHKHMQQPHQRFVSSVIIL